MNNLFEIYRVTYNIRSPLCLTFPLLVLIASGGAAAANAGISDRLFKLHGRWSRDLARMVM